MAQQKIDTPIALLTEGTLSRKPYFEGTQLSTINEITKKCAAFHVYSFIQMSKAIYELAKQESPDVILFAERGGGPIQWIVENLAKREGYSFNILPSPIGLSVNSDIGNGVAKTQGLQVQTKKLVLSDLVGALKRISERKATTHEACDSKRIKIILIDEVQKGGTITDAANLLLNILRESKIKASLSIIGAQDSRKSVINQAKDPEYKRIVTNEREDLHAMQVTLPLVFTDKSSLLNGIIRLNDDLSSKSGLRQLFIHHNLQAQETTLKLMKLIENPAAFALAIRDTSKEHHFKANTAESYAVDYELEGSRSFAAYQAAMQLLHESTIGDVSQTTGKQVYNRLTWFDRFLETIVCDTKCTTAPDRD